MRKIGAFLFFLSLVMLICCFIRCAAQPCIAFFAFFGFLSLIGRAETRGRP